MIAQGDMDAGGQPGRVDDELGGLALEVIGALLLAPNDAGAVKLGAWAIGVADARRNLGLTLEAMTGSESAGAALRSTFDEVSKGVLDYLQQASRQLNDVYQVGPSPMP
jgi:hypothetical protein